MNNEIPEITACSALNCAYNKNMKCHAVAATFGGPHQECDTYSISNTKGGLEKNRAEVGACKVTGCIHNKSMLCAATYVSVGMHNGHADCETFREKAV